jgi:hypothetical protein
MNNHNPRGGKSVLADVVPTAPPRIRGRQGHVVFFLVDLSPGVLRRVMLTWQFGPYPAPVTFHGVPN